MKPDVKPFEVTHHQDSVVEVFLDQPNKRVIELHHRAGGREDLIVHTAQSYLKQFASYPIGQRVLNALVMS